MAQAQERVARLTIPLDRIFFTAALIAAGWLLIASAAVRGEATDVDSARVEREGLHEPVYRVSKTVKANVPIDALAGPETAILPEEEPHPLDPALEMARKSLDHIEQNVRDYTCIIVKRERIDGEMQDYQFMAVKARMAQGEGQQRVPFAVHITYAKPAKVAGRAVEYIEGENDDKMLVRLRKGGFTFRINLDSPRALEESTIPITDLSFDKMLSDAVAHLQSIMKADPQGQNTEADIVTVSNKAPGHSFTEAVKSAKWELNGPGEYEIGGVFLTGVPTGKSDKNGNGRNMVFVFDYDGVNVAHLGNLKAVPSRKQVEAFGSVDVLLVPVGGGGGLNAAKAAEVVNIIEPGLVIPMHYSTPESKIELKSLNAFLKQMGLGSEYEEQETLKVTQRDIPEDTRVVVLSCK